MRRSWTTLWLCAALTACDGDAPGPPSSDVPEDTAAEDTRVEDSSPEDVAADTGSDTQDSVAEDVAEDAAPACTPSELEPFTQPRVLEVPIDGQPIIRGRWDDRDGLAFVIDTGAQNTTFDLDLTDGNEGFLRATELDFGTMVACDVFATGSDLSAADAAIGLNIDALLGQTVLATSYTYVDYRAGEAFLYTTEPSSKPPSVAGVGHLDVAYEANLVPVVGANLGSTTTSLIADTGSGVTVITRSAFDAVEAEHGAPLPQLEGYVWSTSSGSDDAFVTRLPSLRLGAAEVTGSWAVVVPDDFHIRALLEGAGVDAEGFVGAPFYQRFLVEIRGPESAFRLWPYDTTAHLDGERWRSVGVEIALRNQRHVIDMIFSPSDAAQQDIEIGDFLTAVDGQSTDGLPGDAVRALLRGTPGSSRTLTLLRTGSSDPFEVTVQVDDLLPPL